MILMQSRGDLGINEGDGRRGEGAKRTRIGRAVILSDSNLLKIVVD
jgi:hypothetical protein